VCVCVCIHAYIYIYYVHVYTYIFTHTDFTEWSALAGVVMAKWGTEDALDFDSSFTDMMRHAKETLMVCTFCIPVCTRSSSASPPSRKEKKHAQRMDGCSVSSSSLPFPALLFFLPRQSLSVSLLAYPHLGFRSSGVGFRDLGFISPHIRAALLTYAHARIPGPGACK
jgi:hypothetical protein